MPEVPETAGKGNRYLPSVAVLNNWVIFQSHLQPQTNLLVLQVVGDSSLGSRHCTSRPTLT